MSFAQHSNSHFSAGRVRGSLLAQSKGILSHFSIMAPKAALQKGQTMEFVRYEKYFVMHVSTAEDSGHRDLDEVRVKELLQVILDGQHGQTSLTAPSLLAVNGVVMNSAFDGLLMMDNGKNWIAAMKQADELVEKMKDHEKEQCPWYTNSLHDELSNGVNFKIMNAPYPYDKLTHQFIQAEKHLETNNTLLFFSNWDKSSLMRKLFEREGKDWALTTKAAIGILGDKSISTINRWIVLAKDSSELVLEHIRHRRDVPQSFLVGNNFMTGTGSKAAFRLSDEYAILAFDLHQRAMELHKQVTAKEFESEYCEPLRHLQVWAAGITRVHGVSATGFKPFQRAVEKMKEDTGRKKIVAWMNDKELRKQKHFGVPELKTIMDEIANMKSGTNKAAGAQAGGAGEAAPDAGGAGEAAHNDAGEAASGKKKTDEDQDDVDMFEAEVRAAEQVQDPILAKAREQTSTNELNGYKVVGGGRGGGGVGCQVHWCWGEWTGVGWWWWFGEGGVGGELHAQPRPHRILELADVDLVHATVHRQHDEWAADVGASILPSSYPIVWIDCPTSRISTFHDFLNGASDWPKKRDLYISLGARPELVSPLYDACSKKFPGQQIFIITKHTGKQTERVHAGFALYLPHGGGKDVPAQVNVSGCRATSAECLRQRCEDRNCKFRAKKLDEDAEPDEFEEIPPEDRDKMTFEETFDQVEKKDDGDEDDKDLRDQLQQDTLPGAGKSAKGAKPYGVNLYVHAAPLAHHSQILTGPLKADQRTHLLILTRTAHPGLIVAGRLAKLKVIVHVAGVSDHQLAHGDALMKSMLAGTKLRVAKSLVGPSPQKRLRESDLQFLHLEAPPAPDQTVRVDDVEAKEASAWRGALNKAVLQHGALQEKMLNLLNRELSDLGLALMSIDGRMHLTSTKSLRDGQVVCPIAGLTFDRLNLVRSIIYKSSI